MAQVDYPLDKSARAPCLVVLLPGRGDDLDAFDKHGFVAALRARNIQADLVAADAILGYYAKGTFPERLREDVVEPLRKRGYRRIWAVGVSLGGLGAALYSRYNPGVFDGVILIAPYLGDDAIQEEIRKAGGLARWNPAQATSHGDERALWQWLQRTAPQTAPGGPRLYLGFGAQDGMASGQQLLAVALPVDHVFETPGGHDWPVWRTVLGAFVDELAASCSAPPDKQ